MLIILLLNTYFVLRCLGKTVSSWHFLCLPLNFLDSKTSKSMITRLSIAMQYTVFQVFIIRFNLKPDYCSHQIYSICDTRSRNTRIHTNMEMLLFEFASSVERLHWIDKYI